jgi:antitoxin FitA
MATITVRDLEESTRDALRIRAARHGRSMEAEVREILNAAVAAEPRGEEPPRTMGDMLSGIREIFAEIGYADDLVIPPRNSPARVVDFSDER